MSEGIVPQATGCALIHIFSQLTAVKSMQTLWFLHQDIHQAVSQVAH